MHSGTPYLTLRARIADARLVSATRDHALAILEWLGKAEAHVHGTSIDDVHFHELADWDSMLDVVAAGCVAGALDGARWSASALPLGGGTIRAEHGVLPVPGPATAWLATGYAWHDDGVAGERVTPTGAAILRHLVAPSHCGGPRDGGRPSPWVTAQERVRSTACRTSFAHGSSSTRRAAPTRSPCSSSTSTT